jgi:putative endonuclease
MKLTRFAKPLKHEIQAIYNELFGFITMFYTYILYSKKLNVFYKGETKNISDRLYRHNIGYEKSTKLGTPWIILWQDVKSTKSEAKQLERKLKNLSIKRTLQFILKYKDGVPSSDELLLIQ